MEDFIIAALLFACFINFENSASDKKKSSLSFPRAAQTIRLSPLPTRQPKPDNSKLCSNTSAPTSDNQEPLSFIQLPAEILTNILHHLHNTDNVEDLANFAASSTLQHDIAQPLLQQLRPITINVNDITEENLQRLALKHWRTHRITVILRSEWYPPLTGAQLELLAHYFPSVHELNISETDIAVEDLKSLAHFKNLTSLNISGNNLNAKALTIITQLPNAGRIKKLIFSR